MNDMHCQPCPRCPGYKAVSFLTLAEGVRAIILSKYSCSCRLTGTEQERVKQAARVEAWVQ